MIASQVLRTSFGFHLPPNCPQTSQMNYSFKVYYKVRWQLLRSAAAFFYYKVCQPVITKCDSYFITKCDKCYYKVWQVLQSATILLQSATGITKCEDYYKVRQNTPTLPSVQKFNALTTRPKGHYVNLQTPAFWNPPGILKSRKIYQNLSTSGRVLDLFFLHGVI